MGDASEIIELEWIKGVDSPKKNSKLKNFFLWFIGCSDNQISKGIRERQCAKLIYESEHEFYQKARRDIKAEIENNSKL